jgi:hypothetical protein
MADMNDTRIVKAILFAGALNALSMALGPTSLSGEREQVTTVAAAQRIAERMFELMSADEPKTKPAESGPKVLDPGSE